jgi:hypothetical protein
MWSLIELKKTKKKVTGYSQDGSIDLYVVIPTSYEAAETFEY